MKTITQRAIAYTAMREDPFTWREYNLMQDAYHASATSLLEAQASEIEPIKMEYEKEIKRLDQEKYAKTASYKFQKETIRMKYTPKIEEIYKQRRLLKERWINEGTPSCATTKKPSTRPEEGDIIRITSTKEIDSPYEVGETYEVYSASRQKDGVIFLRLASMDGKRIVRPVRSTDYTWVIVKRKWS